MLVAILVGTIAGLAANAFGGGAPWLEWVLAHVAQPVGQLFLRLLFMLVLPLLFSALVLGLLRPSTSASSAGWAPRMLGYTVVVSAIAVAIGMTLVNLVGPGRGLSDEVRALARAGATAITAAPAPAARLAARPAWWPWSPTTPIKAAAGGDMLGVIVFSLLFGVALAVTRTEGAAGAPAGHPGALRRLHASLTAGECCGSPRSAWGRSSSR